MILFHKHLEVTDFYLFSIDLVRLSNMERRVGDFIVMLIEGANSIGRVWLMHYHIMPVKHLTINK